MLNTPFAWEAMADTEAQQRVAHLRRTAAAALHHVHDAFTPWQYLPFGIQSLDALLGVAGVCSGGPGAGPALSSAANGGHRSRGSGGLPVGAVHELYGPPLSGKSLLLRRLAATYVRRMTAFRQWCLEERLCEQMWMLPRVINEDEGTENGKRMEAEPLPTPNVGLCEWDLYVCLVRGTSAMSAAASPSPALPPDVVSWQELLSHALPLSTASPARLSQQQRQRDYAVDHCHVSVISTPNELLDYVERLLHHHLNEAIGSGGAVPATVQHLQPAASPASLSEHSPPFPAGMEATTARTIAAGEGCVQPSKRSRSASADFSVAAATTAAIAGRAWRLHRQRVLLIDGLETLWLHPCLGNHSGTHTGQWFAAELLRRLRCFVAPHAGDADALHDSPFVLYSTVLTTNGCQGGSSNGLQTPLQLQGRLSRSMAAASVLRQSVMTALPRPAGNAVWGIGVDTRCLVEAAHPGLAAPADMTVPPDSPTRRSCHATAVGESHVTVVHGGLCVCAAWVARRGGDEEIPV